MELLHQELCSHAQGWLIWPMKRMVPGERQTGRMRHSGAAISLGYLVVGNTMLYKKVHKYLESDTILRRIRDCYYSNIFCYIFQHVLYTHTQNSGTTVLKIHTNHKIQQKNEKKKKGANKQQSKRVEIIRTNWCKIT